MYMLCYMQMSSYPSLYTQIIRNTIFQYIRVDGPHFTALDYIALHCISQIMNCSHIPETRFLYDYD
jgi:hypothetical protein